MNWRIFTAQLWELWRLTRQEIAWRAVAVLFLSFVTHGLCTLLATEAVFSEIHTIFMSLAYIALMGAACLPFFYGPTVTLGQDWRYFLKAQYPRPATTSQIVVVPLAYDVLVRLGFHVVLAWTFQVLYGLNYPIAGVVVFTAVTGAGMFCAAAAYPGPWTFLGTLVALGGALATILLPGVAEAYSILEDPARWHLLFTFSVSDCLLMALLVVAFVVFAGRAMDRQRHDVAGAERTPDPLQFGRRTPARNAPFSSPLRAQLWMEVRRIADVWQAVGLGVPLALALSFAAAWWGPPQFWFLVWTIAFMLCPAVFILGGTAQLSGMNLGAGAMRLSTFEATQAVPVGRSIALKTAVVFCTHAFGCLLFLAAAVFAWHLFPPAPTARLERILAAAGHLVSSGGVPGVILAGAIVLAAISVTLILLSLAGVYGNQQTEDGGFKARGDLIVSFSLTAYALIAIADLAGPWDFTPFWIVNGWTIALTLVALSLRALWRLYRAALIAQSAIAVAVLGWVVFVIAAAWLLALAERAGMGWSVFGNVHFLVFCVGLSFIPLGSFAWAPLSLAARRSA